MSKKVVAYIRVSTEEQAEHGYSIDVRKIVVTITKPAVVEALIAGARAHSNQVGRQLILNSRGSEIGRISREPLHPVDISTANMRYFRLIEG